MGQELQRRSRKRPEHRTRMQICELWRETWAISKVREGEQPPAGAEGAEGGAAGAVEIRAGEKRPAGE